MCLGYLQESILECVDITIKMNYSTDPSSNVFQSAKKTNIFRSNLHTTQKKKDADESPFFSFIKKITNIIDHSLSFVVIGIIVLLLISVYYFVTKLLFKGSVDIRHIIELKAKVEEFIHFQVESDCERAKNVSVFDIYEHFRSEPMIMEAISLIEQSHDGIDIIEPGFISQNPKFKGYCRLIRSFRRNKIQIGFIGLIIVMLPIIGMFSYVKYAEYHNIQTVSRNILDNMIHHSSQGVTEFSPSMFHDSKMNPNQWERVVSEIERNPVVCVYKKRQGILWRLLNR